MEWTLKQPGGQRTTNVCVRDKCFLLARLIVVFGRFSFGQCCCLRLDDGCFINLVAASVGEDFLMNCALKV